VLGGLLVFQHAYVPGECSHALRSPLHWISDNEKVLNHALSKKDDRTKLTLIFANVSPADILLREEFEKLQKDHPDRFNAVFVVDKPTDGWTGEARFAS
jgi:NAD(P)H-flavin reductase